MGLLGRAEARLLGDATLRFSPTFGVCLPRSGSTFAAQLVTSSLEVAFFPNAAVQSVQWLGRDAAFAPHATLTRVCRALRLDRPSSGPPESQFGRIPSARGGGSDTERVWRMLLWGQLLGVAPDGRLHFSRPGLAYRTVAAVEHSFGRPFFDKSVGHQSRVVEVSTVFPGALFLRIRRNPLAVAQSLFLASVKRAGIAMEQELFRRLRLARRDAGPLEMVARWVHTMDTELDADLLTLPRERVLSLDYEELCRDPRDQLRRVAAWMGEHGAPTRLVREPAPTYPDRNQRRLEPHDYQALRAVLSELYPDPVPDLREA